jgi:hypothetical protein
MLDAKLWEQATFAYARNCFAVAAQALQEDVHRFLRTSISQTFDTLTSILFALLHKTSDMLNVLLLTPTGHDHSERSALLGIPQVNMVNDSCAFNMHFVNWFWNRVTSGSIGGTNQDFEALEPRVIELIRKLYQPGACLAVRRQHVHHTL